jgi:hypothetical protein
MLLEMLESVIFLEIFLQSFSGARIIFVDILLVSLT